MEGHVKILAILYIVFGALGVLAALIILAVFGGAAGIVSSVAQDQPDARIAVPILQVVGGFIVVLLLLLSAPNIIAGLGLLKYQDWARILTIILSVLNIPFIPFGTILGVYGLWVLFNQQTIALFSGVRRASAQG